MNQEVQSSSQELKTQTQNYEQCEQPIKICRQQLDFFKVQLLYSDRETWYAAVHGVAKSWASFFMMYSAYKLNKQGDNIQP